MSLRKELDRRKNLLNRPELLEQPDINNLVVACESYLDDIEANNSREDDDHCIYEAAIEALYGKDVWSFINDCLK